MTSASASSSSAWSLLGVSGAAYAWGLPAIWLIPATVLGFCINWYLIAPRLARASRASGALTLTDVANVTLEGERGEDGSLPEIVPPDGSPAAGKVDPDRFAIAASPIDGGVVQVGDVDHHGPRARVVSLTAGEFVGDV